MRWMQDGWQQQERGGAPGDLYLTLRYVELEERASRG